MPGQKLSTTPLSVLMLLAGLYAAQSITGSMVQTSLPVVLRDAGMRLDEIGFLSMAFLPWALKFLWAPLVDRFGSQRTWILGCQFALILCFFAAAFIEPRTYLFPLGCVLFLMAFVASTQDIATDSYAVHATTAGNRQMASGASTGGAYAGFLIGGGLWLPVYAQWGWETSMAFLAGCIAILTIPTLRIRRQTTPTANQPKPVRPSYRASFANRQLILGLGFLLIYQTGIRLALSMTGPLFVDAGLSLSTIGWIKGVGGTAVGLFAAIIGTLIAQRIGVRRALIVIAILNLLICVGLSTFAILDLRSAATLITLQLALSAGVALSFVALYAAMMDWCSPSQVATDFAILQSADAVLAILAAMAGGMLGEHFGYAPIFILSAIFLALGAVLVRSVPMRSIGPGTDNDVNSEVELGVIS